MKLELMLQNCEKHPTELPCQQQGLDDLQPLHSVIQEIGQEKGIVAESDQGKAADTATPLPNINVLQALRMLKLAWASVTPQTNVNCFKKAKFVPQDDPQDDPKDDIPLSQLAVDEDDIPLASLFQQASQYMEVEDTLDDYVIADQDMIAVTEETEEDIFEDVMSKHIGHQDIQEDEEDEDITPNPSHQVVKPPYHILRTSSCSWKPIQTCLMTSNTSRRIARRTRVKSMNNKKQKTIADFFTQK
ncbi:uncharacterized protein LOC119578014 [Penaeus monodon]|uniref:uncharacterized protein LOC119578014 n=1 Tax=Penaeus monodon TaxID=6687 RepID=UPI0018A779B5|nr:uncharacterized protein LOC119578014 [Penaeus monodon]